MTEIYNMTHDSSKFAHKQELAFSINKYTVNTMRQNPLDWTDLALWQTQEHYGSNKHITKREIERIKNNVMNWESNFGNLMRWAEERMRRTANKNLPKLVTAYHLQLS